MRKSYPVVMVLGLFLTMCTKERILPESISTRIDSTLAVVKVKGDFSNGPYGIVSGQAKIYKVGNGYIVSLENFSSTMGPDLKVYLSLELDPIQFVNLGSLKATSGAQTYTCPAGTDIANYKYVLIYCQQYKHLFGSALF